MLSAMQMFSKEYRSFCQYKVCVDISGGPLEKEALNDRGIVH